MKAFFRNIRWIVPGFAVFYLAACAGMAHFYRNSDVADTFENDELIPQYHYYVSGGTVDPTAIVGLEKGYTLESQYWQPITPDRQMLWEWVRRLQNRPEAVYNMEPNGAKIVDNQGRQIGVWYSVYELPRLTFKSNHVVEISKQETYYPSSNRNFSND